MAKRLILVAVLVLSTLVGVFGAASAQSAPAVGKYVGAIESFDGSMLWVSGLGFQATNAVIDANVAPQVGELVEVKFTANAGTLTAYKVQDVEDDDDGIATVGELTGTLESFDATTALVGGLTFDISQARIDDIVLVSGVLVEIDFVYGDVLFGFRIREGDPDDLNDPFDDVDGDDDDDDDDDDRDDSDGSITGIVQALDASSMTVAGLTFNIVGADIEDDDDEVLAVGVLVEVEYVVEADGSLRAVEIEIDDDDDANDDDDDDSSDDDSDDDDDDFGDDDDSDDDDDDAFDDDGEVTGAIQSLSGTTMVVAGLTFDISRAEVDDDGTLAVGVFVEVEYATLNDGTLLALEIDIEDDDDDDDSDDDDDRDDDDDDRDDDDDDGRANCPRPSGWETYRVRRGDTLSRIAGAAGTTLDALVAANCLANASLIRVGETLYVPTFVAPPSNSGGGSDDDDDDDDDDRDDDDDDDRDDDDDSSGSSDDDDDDGSSGGGSSDDDDDDDDSSGGSDDDDDGDDDGGDDDDD